MTTPQIRRATPDHVPALVRLVYDLAEHERAREECTLTDDQLRTALFGPSPALFAHVAEDETGAVTGCAIWFLTYSTWDGAHGIYLEDLYVDPEARGTGLGKALIAALAKEALEHGYSRVSWSVLTWNTPSIEFYRAIGAAAQDESVGYRLSGPQLSALAATAS